MASVPFLCPTCGGAFQVPQEKIPPGGARGRCKSCGASLTIFPDGRIGPAPVPEGAPAPDEPLWSVTLRGAQGNAEVLGPLGLAEIRDLIASDRLLEDDPVRVSGGEWTPARAFPALATLFLERLSQMDRDHGSPSRCAVHPENRPGWQCLKCQDFLCELCVLNRPLVGGGESRYLCMQCEFETRPVKAEGGILRGLFRKRG